MMDAGRERSSMSVHDAWAMFLRRRWLVAGGLFCCWLLVWGVSWLVPSRYRSETRILIEQQKVPEEYVVANVAVDAEERLESMKQQILSRTRLLRIIDQFHLYEKERARTGPEELVDDMRKRDVEIVPDESSGRRGQLTAFKITYSAPSAALAQQVNAQLTSLFIDENIREQSEQSESTTEFLSSELLGAKQNLAEQEAKIKGFKAENLGQLPSQMESNVRILEGLQERRQNLSQSLNRAQQQKQYLQSMVAQYRSARIADDKGGSSLTSINAQLIHLREQLADAQTKYTESHPDVIKLKSLIAKLEKQKADMEAAMASGTAATNPPPTTSADLQSPLAQLEGQLKANEQEIQDTKRELASVDAQIGGYQGRLNLTPMREQQLADLTRDYEQSKANYDSLLKKQYQSQLATNLQKRQQGEQFRIIDPPSLPTNPYSPDRMKYSLAGLLGGMALGIGLAFLVEMTDDRIRREDEVAEFTNARVLVGIPHLATLGEQRSRRRRHALEWTFALLLLAMIAGGNALTFLRG